MQQQIYRPLNKASVLREGCPRFKTYTVQRFAKPDMRRSPITATVVSTCNASQIVGHLLHVKPPSVDPHQLLSARNTSNIC
jgi:hypothetical protein